VLPETINQQILKAWQDGHGGDAEQVHSFHGKDGMVLLIPKALYKAELDLHRNAQGGSRVLNQYLRTLLERVASDFIPLVEEDTNQIIEDVIPLIDIRSGWAIVFYRYK
jgi:hypothetical protein